MVAEDSHFLEQAEELVKFYREYPEIAAQDLLRVKLSDVQKVVLRAMWFKRHVIAVVTRGGGKTFLNAVLAVLKAMLYPGYRVGLIAPTFRQAKMMFNECEALWQRSDIFQAATERKPTQQSDNCYIRFKASGGKPGSIIQGIPLGDGCLADGLVLLNDRLALIQDLLADNYRPLQEEYLKGVSVFGESASFLPVEYVWSNGKTDNVRIKTSRGYSVEGTQNHPIRVVRGAEIEWSRLDALREGDYVVIDRTSTWHSGSSEITQEEAYVAGLLTGDGNYTDQYRIGFATNDAELLERVNSFFKRRYGKEFRRLDPCHHSLCGKKIRHDFLERLGISGLYTKDKYFPLEVLKAEKYKMVAYIQGLFDTAGGFEVSMSKGGGCVSFYNTSPRLVKDLQNILLLFSIVSTVSVRSGRRENWEARYQLMITGNAVDLFYKHIGFGLGRKQQELERFVLGRKRCVPLSDGIPQAKCLIENLVARYNIKGLRKLCLNFKHLQDHYINGVPAHRVRAFVEHCSQRNIRDERLDLLRNLVEKNYFYDKVVSIERAYSETYDLHIPNDHTFWSNGLISHNTKIRGSRFFTIICDEFPHIPVDIFNMVIRPMAATVANPMENVERVERRAAMLKSGYELDDDMDVASTNQIIISSSGYFMFNHMYSLYCSYRESMLAGDPDYAAFRIPYTLLPKGFLDEKNIESSKREMSSLEFRMEYEAAFIPDTDGFYKASLLESCKSKSFTAQLAGDPNKSYVLGIDPARTEDSFAICIIELGQPCRVVNALELQRKTFPEMARCIEDLCAQYNVTGIYMDSQGGGLSIKDILAENSRNLSEGPILDHNDPIHLARAGRHILRLCNFTPDFISESNFFALRLLEHKEILFPDVPTGEVSDKLEAAWSTINDLKNQLQLIVVTETATGKVHFDVPKGGGHGKQKKDLYTSFMLGTRAAYDLLWAEEAPEIVLNHTGMLIPREERGVNFGVFSGTLPTSVLPGSMQERLALIQNPEQYKADMLKSIYEKRTILVSPSAVLKPKIRKK